MRARPGLVLAIFAAAIVLGGVAYRYLRPTPADAAPLPGMVRQTEIHVAPEIAGRVAALAVASGQHVRKGDVLARLDIPELTASLGEAKAAAASAKADRDRVYSGVRAEEVAIAAQNVQTAEANLLLAQQQNVRVATLAAKNYASKQQLDESNASLAKAQADLDIKRARSAAAVAGPIPQELVLADAKVAVTEATVADLQARLAKTTLTAPADGTIGLLVAELGEIVAPGEPVMTLEVDGERWFTFTIREDGLKGVAIGAPIALTADDGRKIPARVTEMRPLGEFATWRAARAVGDHDLNSFRLRLDPTGGSDGLEPGMSVWFEEQR